MFDTYPGTRLVPALIVAEVVQVLGRWAGTKVEVSFLAELAAGGLVVEIPTHDDWRRCAELVHQYRDLRLGTVDASVVAAAERLNLTAIATLDRRHFSVVRPLHVRAFELVP